MNQNKTFKVDINPQRNTYAILEMPKEFRKGQQTLKKAEISLEKSECQLPKKKDGEQSAQKEYYQQKKKNILIIKDEREKQPFQSQKFIDDLPSAQSFILYKNKDRITLQFISQKSEVYKYIPEERQNLIFKDIDRGLDARKNQENRDKVNIKTSKQVVQTVPEYENLPSSDMEESSPSKKKNNQKQKKNKFDYKLNNSDDEKPKKKVKQNESSSDENSSEEQYDSDDS